MVFDAVTALQKTLNDSFITYTQDIVASLTKHLDDVPDKLHRPRQQCQFANQSHRTMNAHVEALQKLLGDHAGDPQTTSLVN
jgi:hypothetical protein